MLESVGAIFALVMMLSLYVLVFTSRHTLTSAMCFVGMLTGMIGIMVCSLIWVFRPTSHEYHDSATGFYAEPPLSAKCVPADAHSYDCEIVVRLPSDSLLLNSR